MKAKIEEINEQSIIRGKEIIERGGVVAFPTETVYGLGVSAYNGKGVSQVFEVKGRPNDNPLIVHIGDISDIAQATENCTPLARKLLEHFAPGPITVVVDKGSKIANEVTAGLDSVGIRIPELQSARDFIRATKVPLAAPSANTSTRPSPTTANAVYEDIGDKIELILDGGACSVGIESTVVDCRFDTPIILRSGKITREDIAKVCGSCDIATSTSTVRSPGVKYKHYAPSCDVIAVRTNDINTVQQKVDKYVQDGKKVVLIGCDNLSEVHSAKFISLGKTVDDFMRNYFETLRKGEKIGNIIVCVLPFDESVAEGLYNRVKKSCGGNIV